MRKLNKIQIQFSTKLGIVRMGEFLNTDISADMTIEMEQTLRKLKKKQLNITKTIYDLSKSLLNAQVQSVMPESSDF